jgi:WD40 repeat protein
VAEAALGPDCRTLLTVGRDGGACLWNALTGQRVASLRTGAEGVASFGFSPDGRRLFIDDWAGVIRVWSTTDGGLRCQTAPRPGCYQLGGPPGYRVFARTRHHHSISGDRHRLEPLPVQFSGDRILTFQVGQERGQNPTHYSHSAPLATGLI